MVHCVLYRERTSLIYVQRMKVIKLVVDGARLRLLQVQRVQEGQRNFVDSHEARSAAVVVGCGLILFYTT